MGINLVGIFILLLSLTFQMAQKTQLSMFYCGFSGDYCGQSLGDDVNSNTTIVILAFANILPDGKVVADENNFPKDQVSAWKQSGKKVLISVGGQNGLWPYAYANETTRANFIVSLTAIVRKFKLSGVDMAIENYITPPRIVAETIKDLKTSLKTLGANKLLVVSPEDVTVYQGIGVPDPDQGGHPFNYFVPIIKLADDSIDYYQPQAYNNWYDGLAGGSLDYIKDVYLNWRNLQGLSKWAHPLPDFNGVSEKKLLIGIMASPQAGGAQFYAEPAVIRGFKQFLSDNQYSVRGFMVWDSHWDQLNNYAISKACSPQ